MKIAMTIPWFLPNRGGAELGAWELSRRLVAKGHQVLVVTPRFRLDWPPREVIDGIEVVRYVSLAPSRFRRLSEAAHCLQAIPGVFRALNDFQPDVTHLHYTFFTGYAAMLWSKRHHKPTVLTLVGNDVYDPYYVPCAFLNPATTWVIREADHVVAASNFIRDVVTSKFGKPREEINLIPYGVDLQRFKPVSVESERSLRMSLGLPSDKKIVLTVQRLHERKGIDHYIAAASDMLQKRSDLYFVIVGDGPERASLEKQVSSLGLENSIRFTGKVSDEDLPKYYATCDLFAFHTLHEGFGIVLLEAMASGKAVITTKAGGTLDIVIPGENGLLVEPGDPMAFSQNALALLANETRCKEMGITQSSSCGSGLQLGCSC